MALLNLIFISLFVFIITTLFLLDPIYAQKPCKSSECNKGGLQIRFPFLLKGQQLDEISCGYPGFNNLTCSSQGEVAIDLPFSGRFFVREIDYYAQKIKLYDPNNCLPGRILLGLNLSGSPFVDNWYTYYSFFNCPVMNSTSYNWLYQIVTCLSNSTNTVMVIEAAYDSIYVLPNCVKMVTVYAPYNMRNEMSDMLLRWNLPECMYCERGGGVCGLRSVGSQDVVCFPTEGRVTLWWVLFMTIFISIAIVILCVVFLIKYRLRHSQDTNNSTQISLGSGLGSLTSPQSSTITGGRAGLDDSTIQSYPEVILGETSHISGLNDNNCPICLSEFRTRETVRFIPECTHCFHSNCIDEWLRLNRSCPVCRSLPTQSHSPHIVN